MSKLVDFFKALATSSNDMEDDATEKELNEFLSENSDSSKRIAFLESNLHVELPAQGKKPVEKVKTKKVSTKSNSKEQEIDNEEKER